MDERRRRLIQRAAPVAAIAAVSFAIGAIVGGSAGAGGRDAAVRFARAWTLQDFAAMHAELSDAARERFPLKQLARAYQQSYATATTITVRAGRPSEPRPLAGRDTVRLGVTVRTRAFGRLDGELEVPLDGGGVAWDEHLVFPGLRPGERLDRKTETPPRAPILARDGTPLAEGPPDRRDSPLGEAARHVAGKLGPPPAEDALALERAGFPPETQVGTSGLEKAFDARLAGRPGGSLLAIDERGSSRVLASSRPRPARAVRTTIDPELQRAAVAALAGRFGGVAVLDARDGSVRALAGVAYSAPQPPGSTFKIVTAAAALESGAAEPDSAFPVQRAAPAGGRLIENAHKEPCGGTFVQSFARSCNSVFAPLGVKVGAGPLVAIAERFGFNSSPQLFNQSATEAVEPAASTIPKTMESDLDLAVSAIGQGRVLATPLQLASAALTVAGGGIRRPTPLVADPKLGPGAKPVRAVSERTARALREMMVATVAYGTGRLAAIAGTQVAGKTGTAELGSKARQGELTAEPEEEEQETDAWFAAFAPARRPKLVLAVMLIKANADGGEVAAPAARQILAAGLQGSAAKS